MANCWFYSPVIFLSLSIHIAFNQRQLKADPISVRIVGVFMIPENGKYEFNATEASDACLSLGATIATREQMEVALLSGFQTCKFGWMDDQHLVIVPRNTPDQKCGKGKKGLVPWTVSASKRYAAFCFKPEDVHTTTTIPVAFKPTTAAMRRRYARTTASPTQVPRHTSKAPPLTKPRRTYTLRHSPRYPVPPRSPKPTGRSSWYPSSSSSSSSPTSSTSSLPLHSTPPPAAPHAMTSRTPARKWKSTPATPVRGSSLSSFPLHPSFSAAATSTSTSTSPTTTTTTTTTSPTTTTSSTFIPTKGLSENMLLHSSKGSLGGLQVALIVMGLIVLVISIAAASWFCKLQRFLFPLPWARPQQTRDDVETEMWKHDSDTHLQTQLSEEDKTDGKNATEAKLCLSPSDSNTIAAV